MGAPDLTHNEQLQQFAVHDQGGPTLMPPARKGPRFLAALLDGFFSGILSGLGAIVLTKALHGGFMATTLWNFTFPFIYFVFPIYASGQTLGKKIMKIKIVHVDPLQEPSMGRIFYREFVGKFVGAIVFMLGYVRIFTHPDRRAWHDTMAHTRVVTLTEE